MPSRRVVSFTKGAVVIGLDSQVLDTICANYRHSHTSFSRGLVSSITGIRNLLLRKSTYRQAFDIGPMDHWLSQS